MRIELVKFVDDVKVVVCTLNWESISEEDRKKILNTGILRFHGEFYHYTKTMSSPRFHQFFHSEIVDITPDMTDGSEKR